MHPLSCAFIVGGMFAIAGGAAAASFSRADANRDGRVSYEEARRVLPDLNRVHFAKFVDAPDGTVSKGNWAALDNFYYLAYRLD